MRCPAALGVSQAWFYKWRRGDPSLRRKRREVLASVIAYLFQVHRGPYGSPRITADLRQMGWKVSENTVAKVMAEQDLVARRKRTRRGTTRRDTSGRKAPDALRRDFRPPATPNARWVGDLTEIPTDRANSTWRRSWTCTGDAAWALPWGNTTMRRWRGRRCAWRSRSAAARWPEWSSIPTRAASTPGGSSRGPVAGPTSPSPWAVLARRWTTRSLSRSTGPPLQPQGVATRSLPRRAYGRPLTPEPLQPLTRSGMGRTSSPARQSSAALNHEDARSIQIKSLRFEGIARPRSSAQDCQVAVSGLMLWARALASMVLRNQVARPGRMPS